MTQSLYPFEFFARPKPIGGEIELSFYLPATQVAGPGFGMGAFGWTAFGGFPVTGVWTGRIVIMKKRYEFPRDPADPNALTVYDHTFAAPFSTEKQYVDDDGAAQTLTELPGGVMYYYTAFTEEVIGGAPVWVEVDPRWSFAFSYAYKDWGFSEYIYNNLMSSSDRKDDEGDLSAIWENFGLVFNGIKTDIERLSHSFDPLEVAPNLLLTLSEEVNWELDDALIPERKRRKLLSEAIERYKERGRVNQPEEIFEFLVPDWDMSIKEGLPRVFWLNDIRCKLPDITGNGPALRDGAYLYNDTLFYMNGSEHGRSMNGWLVEIANTVPEKNLQLVVSLAKRVLDEWKSHFCRYSLIILPDEIAAEADTGGLVNGEEDISGYVFLEDFEAWVLTSIIQLVTMAVVPTDGALIPQGQTPGKPPGNLVAVCAVAAPGESIKINYTHLLYQEIHEARGKIKVAGFGDFGLFGEMVGGIKVISVEPHSPVEWKFIVDVPGGATYTFIFPMPDYDPTVWQSYMFDYVFYPGGVLMHFYFDKAPANIDNEPPLFMTKFFQLTVKPLPRYLGVEGLSMGTVTLDDLRYGSVL